MIFRFTVQAQNAMQFADQEARRIQHEYVGTEHVLLGLFREKAGLASKVLHNLGLELLDIRGEVLHIVGFGPEPPIEGMLPYTPRAKMALKYAMDETDNVQVAQLGTLQLLHGILREKEGVGAQVLENLGVNLPRLRTTIINLLALGLDDTVSKETFESVVGPEENAVPVPGRQKAPRPKITASSILVRIAQVEGFSMRRAAQLAEHWHREFIARHGHPWSKDWDAQLALSLHGEDGAAVQPEINKKWYPWWRRLLVKLSTDGIFESPDCPEKWKIRD